MGNKIAEDVQKNMNINFIDRVMCSTTCPCDPTYKNLWEGPMNEQYVNKRLRSWESSPKAPLVAFDFSEKEKTEAGKPIETFEDCYTMKIRDHPEILQGDYKALEAFRDFTSKDSINLLRYYETEYECSGFCDLPLFYLTKDLAKGPPEIDCVDAVILTFTDNYLVAALSAVGMFMFWAAALSTLPNCCGKGSSSSNDAPSSRKKGNHVELAEDPNASGYDTGRYR